MFSKGYKSLLAQTFTHDASYQQSMDSEVIRSFTSDLAILGFSRHFCRHISSGNEVRMTLLNLEYFFGVSFNIALVGFIYCQADQTVYWLQLFIDHCHWLSFSLISLILIITYCSDFSLVDIVYWSSNTDFYSKQFVIECC